MDDMDWLTRGWSESKGAKNELWFEIARVYTYTSLFMGLGKAVLVKTYQWMVVKILY